MNKILQTIRKKIRKGIPNPYSLIPNPKKNGFTIAELLIATIILGILLTTSGSIYANFYNSVRNLRAANLVYDEARFTMERIAKEIRNGAVDYEEYFNQATNFKGTSQSTNQLYGSNYCQYSRQFYEAGPDGKFGTYDDESTGLRKAGSADPLSTTIQDDLYLINVVGDKRAYIKRLVDANGLGRVGLLKLEGFDYGLDGIDSDTGGPGCTRDSGEKDGLIDTWFCEKGFNCTGTPAQKISGFCSGPNHTIFNDPDSTNPTSSFVYITPSTIDITSLKFFITPSDDPHKAYADPETQIQPHVSIRLSVKANKQISSQFKGGSPNINLESTVSTRAYTEIITECNLQECIDGDTKTCPKIGVATGTTITCAQGVWPACTDADYEATADLNFGLDTSSPFGATGYTYYEKDTEFGYCDTLTSPDSDTCKSRRCSDGYDNDGDGLADDKDPVCLFQLCNNGYQDPGEDCPDVGGTCSFRRKKSVEVNDCFDGYDNDCDGGADQFDTECIDSICGNGKKDPISPNVFLRSDYTPQNYLLGASASDVDSSVNEKCPDIGGICAGATPAGSQILTTTENNATLCSDGWDNDCDGFADELDTECQTIICNNGTLDCDLVNDTYTPKDYLKGYSDASCHPLQSTNLDEKCKADQGGLCGSLPTAEYLKSDGITIDNTQCTSGGIDDDCDGLIDQADDDCCPDSDGDGYNPAVVNRCTPSQVDCNDSDVNVNPGATEICDSIDNDCDSQIDEGLLTTYYQDSDGDNYGNSSASQQACSQPVGYVTDNTDCNDSESNSYPGNSEICDAIDNDCDSLVDEGVKTTFYQDSDSDGYGDSSSSTQACSAPVGYVSDSTDCDDTDVNVNPGETEICGDSIDNNCNASDDC